MGLNVSKGNMYDWVTHTWNTIKGSCYHDCSYCYMKRWGRLSPCRLDEKELKTDLGSGNFIFVGSSCDIWADDIPDEWISKTLYHCSKFDNTYLFQTKNPANIRVMLPHKSVICITLETNRWYPDIMNNSPSPKNRVEHIIPFTCPIYVTIEPIMDFDIDVFVKAIKLCNPVQVNIGADSGNNNLPEPNKEKLFVLISELTKFTIVKQKKNLKRLLN